MNPPQYDLLVELKTRAIEILELRYGDVSYNESIELEGQDSVLHNHSNKTSQMKTDMEVPPATVTWSHKLQLAVEPGVTLKVTRKLSSYLLQCHKGAHELKVGCLDQQLIPSKNF